MGKNKQKTVITKKEPCNKSNYYAMINLDALEFAATTLSSDAFKMWIYFSKNQDNYTQQLSSKYAQENFNLSKRAYDTAIHELINKGFLIDTNSYYDKNDTVNHWCFYEKPLVSNGNKGLQQIVISLDVNKNKACLPVDTSNNTDITQTTEKKNFIF